MYLVMALVLAVGFHEAKPLEPAAAYVAHKHVTVLCANSEAAWHSYVASELGSDAGSHGLTIPGSGVVRLETAVCNGVGDSGVALKAEAIEVLTHESIHARGETEEGVTDCDAMHETPGVAVRFFGVKAGSQLRAMMAAVWTWHREQPPAYQAVC